VYSGVSEVFFCVVVCAILCGVMWDIERNVCVVVGGVVDSLVSVSCAMCGSLF